jgi:hypothetical protein
MTVYHSSITEPTTTPKPLDEREFLRERARVARALSSKHAKLPPVPDMYWPGLNPILVVLTAWIVAIAWWMWG